MSDICHHGETRYTITDLGRDRTWWIPERRDNRVYVVGGAKVLDRLFNRGEFEEKKDAE